MVKLHPSLLGSGRAVSGGATSPPPATAGSCPTASTAPAPSAAMVCMSAHLPTPVPTPLPVDWFTLPPIKTGSDYLRTRYLILFWLRCPGFSTGCLDADLITDTANSLASQYWEEQLCMAVRDGLVCFLFHNTRNLYYGCRFEMLAILEANLCPNTFSNAFATLLSHITNKQDEECIHEFQACFEGHLNNIS
jgi:hypothetical protein